MSKLSVELIESMMERALTLAQKAAQEGEVPVGAIIAKNDEVIAEAYNQIEKENDATSHAEILAIRKASQSLGSWRLTDVQLYVTLEPCSMCAGAIKLARIPTIIFGASDPRLGAAGSLFDLLKDPRTGSVPRVISGVKAESSLELLQNFFKTRRKN